MPWASLLWANAASAVAPEDGTIGAPFVSLQDAVDGVLTGGSVLAGVGAYAGPVTITGKIVHITGQGNAEGGPGGNATVAGFTLSSSFVRLQSLTLTGGITVAGIGALFFHNVAFAGNTISGTGTGNLTLGITSDGLEDCHAGSVECNSLRAVHAVFDSQVLAVGFVTAEHCVFQHIAANVGDLDHCVLNGDLNFTDRLTLIDCDFPIALSITAAPLQMDALSFSRAVAANVSFLVVPELIDHEPIREQVGVDTINGCTVAAPIEGANIGADITVDPSDGNDFVIDPGWTGTITLGTGSAIYGREIITLKRLVASADAITILNGGPGGGNIGPDGNDFPASVPLVCDYVQDLGSGNWSLAATKRLP